MATGNAPPNMRVVVASLSCSRCRSGAATESTAGRCASCREFAGRARMLARCLEDRQMIEAVSVVEGFAEACVWARLGCADVAVILGCGSDPPADRLAELARDGMRVAWVAEEPVPTSLGFAESDWGKTQQAVVTIQWRGDVAETARVIWELMVAGTGCAKPTSFGSLRWAGRESKRGGIAEDQLARSSNGAVVADWPNDVPLGLVFASLGKAAGATTLTALTAVAASRRGYKTVVVDLDRRSSDLSMVLRSITSAGRQRWARDWSNGPGHSSHRRVSELVGDDWKAERLARNLCLVSPIREDNAGLGAPSDLWSYLRTEGSSGIRLYLIDAGEIIPANGAVGGENGAVASRSRVSDLEMARTACPAVWRSLLVCRADRTGVTHFLREACRLADVITALPEPAIVLNCSTEDSRSLGGRLDVLFEQATGLPVVLRIPLERDVAEYGPMRESTAVPSVANRLLESVFASRACNGEPGLLEEASPHEGDYSSGSGRNFASRVRALLAFSFRRQLAGFRSRSRRDQSWGDLGPKNTDASEVEAKSVWTTHGRIRAGAGCEQNPRTHRLFEARGRVVK